MASIIRFNILLLLLPFAFCSTTTTEEPDGSNSTEGATTVAGTTVEFTTENTTVIGTTVADTTTLKTTTASTSTAGPTKSSTKTKTTVTARPETKPEARTTTGIQLSRNDIPIDCSDADLCFNENVFGSASNTNFLLSCTFLLIFW
ncbi:uncharacterized protein CELE_W03D8.14 [Caenorhabditis elegans]|uniref:Uncharacterized protein n=1 Tax=Caenorhabditis elegans TaxID=6239 RepID=A0A078BQM5_CAEEL|nr:Uncharacterized protein CELE_W03D8.14 [Caenorhabditis elegans]CDX47482.1 Uncharacterized protein CELE_W03D8.14 [Caenorhabditis elegans]|eukprot:NP_001293385.1 Uncharacterized protein CELE_W03D8.14 [Caenorhabditis elegans]